MSSQKIHHNNLTTVVLSLFFSCSFFGATPAWCTNSELVNKSHPSFNIENIPSAWKGHRPFAEWLVHTMKPQQIVDLGVDYGYSTFVFALAARDLPYCTVTGVDLFAGDPQTGARNTYNQVLEWKNDLNLMDLELIQGDFHEVSLDWTRLIDILHIDGYHSYEAVSADFAAWSKFVSEKGIVLFHDINVPNPGYQVIKFFRELTEGRRLYFLHSYGLGIYTKDDALAELILDTFSNVRDFDEIPF